MIIEQKAKLLTAESKPYNFNGNEGISNTVRFLIDGEIFPVKTVKESVDRLQSKISSEGTVSIDIQSRKERLSLVLVDFVSK